MNKRMARLVTRLYPRAWRERYGEEFVLLLMAETTGLRTLLDVGWSALREHWQPEAPGRPGFTSILKKPSAVVPMGMSLAALGVVCVHIAMAGTARQADEGAAAHSWQLLMGMQVPILIYFAIRSLPRAPRQAFSVMALQAMAAAAALAPVLLLRW